MNNYLENYSKTRIIEIRGDPSSIIIHLKTELFKYSMDALDNNRTNKRLHLGIIPKQTIIRLEKDIKGNKSGLILDENIQYDLFIDQETIRHIKKKSIEKNMVFEYIYIVGEVIAKYDIVEYSIYKHKQHILRFKKNTNNGHYIAVTIVSNSKRRFRVHTIFLLKKDFLAKKRS